MCCGNRVLNAPFLARREESHMHSLNHYRLHIETMIEMNDGCPISYTASAEGVDFTIGDQDENFAISTSPTALDNLIATPPKPARFSEWPRKPKTDDQLYGLR